MSDPVDVDSESFRDCLATWASGVTVITASGPSSITGMTASSFSSLSIDPPLILVCIAKRSGSHNNLVEAEGFAVHILGQGQEELSNRFATAGVDKFDGIHFESGPFDAPLLELGAARLVCARHDVLPGGDHSIMVGRVVEAERGTGGPLLYHSRSYGGFQAND